MDICLGKDITVPNLSALTTTGLAAAYTTANLAIKVPISLRFVVLADTASCPFTVGFSDASVPVINQVIYTGTASTAPLMIDLQIGSTGTEADVWQTITQQLCTCGRRTDSYTRNPIVANNYSTVMYNYPFTINSTPAANPTQYVPTTYL